MKYLQVQQYHCRGRDGTPHRYALYLDGFHPWEIIQTIRSGLSPFPVISEDADDVKGLLIARDYLLNERKEKLPFEALIRRLHFVPEKCARGYAFPQYAKQRSTWPIVVDEYMEPSGRALTMEEPA